MSIELDKLDETDLRILKMLKEDARTAYTEIARKLGVSNAKIHDRVTKLKEKGILKGFHADIDFGELGYEVCAIVGLRTELAEKIYRTIEELQSIPQVQEIHVVSGDYDLMLKVRAKTPRHLQDLLLDEIDQVFGFHRSTTMMILSSPMEKCSPDPEKV